MKKIVFIGPAGGGKIPTNGASVKNYYIIKHLRRCLDHLNVCDTENWKKSPIVLLKLLWTLLFNRGARYILSANNTSSYRMLRMMGIIGIKDIVYWVIGGSIAEWIEEGKVKIEPYQLIRLFIVEGEKMRITLNRCGFNNVQVIPNFKAVCYLPQIPKYSEHRTLRFLFLSRIIPEKGCDLIFEASNLLDKKGLYGKYNIDFWGPIAKDYKDAFISKIGSTNSIKYCGFLDLRDNSNYTKLASYDVMLFPTFWHGEGFPGIFIDAFIAGLPVLATDWSMNGEVIKDGVNGWLIESNNSVALSEKMEYIIIHKKDLEKMKKNCQEESRKFHVDNVLNESILERVCS